MTKRSLIKRVATRLAKEFSLSFMLENPRILQIVPTNACNLRCRACNKNYYRSNNDHMSPEVYKRIKKQVFDTAEMVNLQGLGEPTLSPMFTEMLEDAIRYNFFITFVTNASKLSMEHIRLLAQARASVVISIDGARADTHQYSKVGSNFSQILDVLQQLKETRKQYPSGQMSICFSTVVTRYNIGEIADIVRLAKKFDVSNVNLITPGVGDRKDEFALQTIGYYEDIYRKYLPDIQKTELETGVSVSYPTYILQPSIKEVTEKIEISKKSKRIFLQKCYAPFTEIYVDVDGWIRPCCATSSTGMGNILENDLRSIWNNRHYRKLRRTLNSNNPPEFCRVCGLNTGINGGDEKYLEKLYAQGLPPLPDPPKIGFHWSEEEHKAIEY